MTGVPSREGFSQPQDITVNDKHSAMACMIQQVNQTQNNYQQIGYHNDVEFKLLLEAFER
jgi:hypothetical protein